MRLYGGKGAMSQYYYYYYLMVITVIIIITMNEITRTIQSVAG